MVLTFEQAAYNKSDSDSADGVMFRSSHSSAGFLWCALLKCVNGCHHLVTSSAVDSFGVLTIVMLLDLFGFIGICIWLAVCGRCLRVVCYVSCWCILGFGFQRDADCLCWCCLWLCNCVCVCVQFLEFADDLYTYVMTSSFLAVVIFSLTMLMLLVSFSSAFSADV